MFADFFLKRQHKNLIPLPFLKKYFMTFCLWKRKLIASILLGLCVVSSWVCLFYITRIYISGKTSVRFTSRQQQYLYFNPKAEELVILKNDAFKMPCFFPLIYIYYIYYIFFLFSSCQSHCHLKRHSGLNQIRKNLSSILLYCLGKWHLQ